MAFGGNERGLSGHLLVSEMMFVHYFHLFIYIWKWWNLIWKSSLLPSYPMFLQLLTYSTSVFCHLCGCFFFFPWGKCSSLKNCKRVSTGELNWGMYSILCTSLFILSFPGVVPRSVNTIWKNQGYGFSSNVSAWRNALWWTRH